MSPTQVVNNLAHIENQCLMPNSSGAPGDTDKEEGGIDQAQVCVYDTHTDLKDDNPAINQFQRVYNSHLKPVLHTPPIHIPGVWAHYKGLWETSCTTVSH